MVEEAEEVHLKMVKEEVVVRLRKVKVAEEVRVKQVEAAEGGHENMVVVEAEGVVHCPLLEEVEEEVQYLLPVVVVPDEWREEVMVVPGLRALTVSLEAEGEELRSRVVLIEHGYLVMEAEAELGLCLELVVEHWLSVPKMVEALQILSVALMIRWESLLVLVEVEVPDWEVQQT